jgi:hypothetical protein
MKRETQMCKIRKVCLADGLADPWRTPKRAPWLCFAALGDCKSMWAHDSSHQDLFIYLFTAFTNHMVYVMYVPVQKKHEPTLWSWEKVGEDIRLFEHTG